MQDGVWGVEQWASPILPPIASASTPILPSARLCQGEGMGDREPLPARWMGEIKPDLVSLLAAKPGALAALQLSKERPGRGHRITRASLCPLEEAKHPPLRSHHPHHWAAHRGMHRCPVSHL